MARDGRLRRGRPGRGDLRHRHVQPGDRVFHGPKVYGSLSGTALGTLIGYLGNRYWVFRHRDRRQSTTEITLFLLVSASAC